MAKLLAHLLLGLLEYSIEAFLDEIEPLDPKFDYLKRFYIITKTKVSKYELNLSTNDSYSTFT